jgi:hypothetical protein
MSFAAPPLLVEGDKGRVLGMAAPPAEAFGEGGLTNLVR